MNRRIRKNAKEFAAAVANAKNIRCYSLDNCFSGKSADVIPAYLANDFELSHDGETYKARVHSNLWYEFNASIA